MKTIVHAVSLFSFFSPEILVRLEQKQVKPLLSVFQISATILIALFFIFIIFIYLFKKKPDKKT